MRKSGVLLFIFMLTVMLSGCILSKTPTTNSVAIPLGEPMTFNVKVFPSNATYAWTLDGASLSITSKSYVYTAAAGDHTLEVKAKHILGTDTQTWNIQTPNPPVANAGADQSVYVDSVVTLNGSGSTDPDDDIVSYNWQQIGGTAVSLINANMAIAHFTASVAAGSTLTFKLTVTDEEGLFSTDTCVKTIPNPISDLLNSLVHIPGGSFIMGSTDNENGYAQFTTPVHTVTLAGFDIGAYEVTQAQYLAVIGANPSIHKPPVNEVCANCPVEYITWPEAREFCTALSAITGRTFTLPSEAQWEYACRAGATTLYSFGDSEALLGDYTWCDANSNSTTHDVGAKLPNAWGIYDMNGNVWELCLDSYHSNYNSAPTDGSAWDPETGSSHMTRGSSYCYISPGAFRPAFRMVVSSSYRDPSFGFRVVAIP